jgi:glycosyltransferase
VYNNRRCIADCIESVLGQTYTNIEHIVIDGGSTDGTQQIIEQYSDRLACYVSEKDGGLYDALNKGIRHATGDIIGVLHSDDLFFAEDTLAKIAAEFERTNPDLLYANGKYVDRKDIEKVKRIYRAKPFRMRYLKFGWIPLHTTIFVKKNIFEKYGDYDINFSIASDYEISLRWFLNNDIKKIFLDEYVVKMRLGGKSTSVGLQKAKSAQDLQILKKYNFPTYFTLFGKITRKIPQYYPYIYVKLINNVVKLDNKESGKSGFRNNKAVNKRIGTKK